MIFKNDILANTSLRSNVILTLMLSVLLLLPVFKGGNFPGVMAIFVFVSSFIFLLSMPDFNDKRDFPWLIVWLVFSVAVILHALLYPLIFVNERFFVDGLEPQVAQELNSRYLSKMRMVEVWAFFTSMWIFAWRISISSVANVKLIILALFLASSFQSFFGLAHFVSGSSSVLGLWDKEHYLKDATGTFVNRNHFSGMLAISAPLVLSSLLMPKPLLLPKLSKSFRVVTAICYLIILVLALISSHSRMGLMVAILGLVSCYFLMSRTDVASNKNFGRVKFLSIFVLLFLFCIWYGVGDILQRYAELNDGNSRFDVWNAMFTKLHFNVWLFGAGPGSFESIFQTIKPSNFSVRFIYAHNDYLEFVFEFGILFSVLILFSLIYWLKSNKSNLTCTSYLRAGIYASFIVIAFHSLVDFNLQIPASALCFWLSFGLLANSKAISYGVDVQKGDVKIKASQNQKQQMRSKQFKLPRTKHEWARFLRSD